MQPGERCPQNGAAQAAPGCWGADRHVQGWTELNGPCSRAANTLRRPAAPLVSALTWQLAQSN